MRDPDHLWKGRVQPTCMQCGCTSLEAQFKQPDTKGAGPCPLAHDMRLAQRLFDEWLARRVPL